MDATDIKYILLIWLCEYCEDYTIDDVGNVYISDEAFRLITYALKWSLCSELQSIFPRQIIYGREKFLLENV